MAKGVPDHGLTRHRLPLRQSPPGIAPPLLSRVKGAIDSGIKSGKNWDHDLLASLTESLRSEDPDGGVVKSPDRIWTCSVRLASHTVLNYLTSISLLFCLTLLAGCGPAGSPPEITDLRYPDDALDVGKEAVFTGSVDFKDPDGDVTAFSAAVTTPDGREVQLGEAPVAEASGHRSGTALLRLVVKPESVGEYVFDLWLIDEAGHRSNKLPGRLTVR